MKNYVLFPIDEELFGIYKRLVMRTVSGFIADPFASPYWSLIIFGVFTMESTWPLPGYVAPIKLSPDAPHTIGHKEELSGQCYLKVEIDG